ncbi:hypothetical protein D3C87_1763810 [compost metagenome]
MLQILKGYVRFHNRISAEVFRREDQLICPLLKLAALHDLEPALLIQIISHNFIRMLSGFQDIAQLYLNRIAFGEIGNRYPVNLQLEIVYRMIADSAFRKGRNCRLLNL